MSMGVVKQGIHPPRFKLEKKVMRPKKKKRKERKSHVYTELENC